METDPDCQIVHADVKRVYVCMFMAPEITQISGTLRKWSENMCASVRKVLPFRAGQILLIGDHTAVDSVAIAVHLLHRRLHLSVPRVHSCHVTHLRQYTYR